MKTKQPKQKELPIEKLTIDRKRWLRGETDSVLRNKKGLMCCLGFYCLRKRFKVADILDVTSPSDVIYINGTTRLDRLIVLDDDADDNAVCNNLMIINDNTDISDKQRERRITQLFKKINVEVKFVN